MIKYLVILVLLSGCLNTGDKKDENVNSHNVNSQNDNSDNSGGDASDGDSPFCVGTYSNDGPGGFLWKPVSETDGNLAILFPEEYKKFLSVRVTNATTGEIEDLVYSSSDGGRQVWRASEPGEAYSGQVISDNGTSECTWVVSDPAIRND